MIFTDGKIGYSNDKASCVLHVGEIKTKGRGYGFILRCAAENLKKAAADVCAKLSASGASHIFLASGDERADLSQLDGLSPAFTTNQMELSSDDFLLRSLNSRVSLKRLDESKAGEFINMYNDCFDENEDAPTAGEKLVYKYLTADYKACFIMNGVTPVGVLVLNFTENEPIIEALGVLRYHRHYGYARAAMGLAINEVFAQGYDEVKLQVSSNNDNAVDLYTSLGFKQKGKPTQWYRVK